MDTYRIRLEPDGREYEVPPKATVMDYGYSISVEQPCVCSSCGNRHNKTLENWPKGAVRSASITANGVMMWIVSEKKSINA